MKDGQIQSIAIRECIHIGLQNELEITIKDIIACIVSFLHLSILHLSFHAYLICDFIIMCTSHMVTFRYHYFLTPSSLLVLMFWKCSFLQLCWLSDTIYIWSLRKFTQLRSSNNIGAALSKIASVNKLQNSRWWPRNGYVGATTYWCHFSWKIVYNSVNFACI